MMKKPEAVLVVPSDMTRDEVHSMQMLITKRWPDWSVAIVSDSIIIFHAEGDNYVQAEPMKVLQGADVIGYIKDELEKDA